MHVLVYYIPLYPVLIRLYNDRYLEPGSQFWAVNLGRFSPIATKLDQSAPGCTNCHTVERKGRTRAQTAWRGHAIRSAVTSLIQATEWRLEN
ncbi:hypothetical protein NQZ68_016853 [Dissostichus eleginoides]|nr:hypothetical protein NQZ68_016853 [Dissostichus eleginoides]